MKFLGWDCASKTLGWTYMSINLDIYKQLYKFGIKLDMIINNHNQPSLTAEKNSISWIIQLLTQIKNLSTPARLALSHRCR